MKCLKSFIIQHCWFNYLSYERLLLAGQSQSRVFGSWVLSFTPNSSSTLCARSTSALHRGGTPWVQGSVSQPCSPGRSPPHLHSPGSPRRPRSTRLWKCRVSARCAPRLWKAKARACTLPESKGCAQQERGLAVMNLTPQLPVPAHAAPAWQPRLKGLGCDTEPSKHSSDTAAVSQQDEGLVRFATRPMSGTNIHPGKPTLIHQTVIQNDRKYRLEFSKKL